MTGFGKGSMTALERVLELIRSSSQQHPPSYLRIKKVIVSDYGADIWSTVAHTAAAMVHNFHRSVGSAIMFPKLPTEVAFCGRLAAKPARASLRIGISPEPRGSLKVKRSTGTNKQRDSGTCGPPTHEYPVSGPPPGISSAENVVVEGRNVSESARLAEVRRMLNEKSHPSLLQPHAPGWFDSSHSPTDRNRKGSMERMGRRSNRPSPGIASSSSQKGVSYKRKSKQGRRKQAGQQYLASRGLSVTPRDMIRRESSRGWRVKKRFSTVKNSAYPPSPLNRPPKEPSHRPPQEPEDARGRTNTEDLEFQLDSILPPPTPRGSIALDPSLGRSELSLTKENMRRRSQITAALFRKALDA